MVGKENFNIKYFSVTFIIMTLDSKIEAVLFFKAEPIQKKKLANLLDTSIEEISCSLLILEEKLKERGLSLIYKEDEVSLGTNPQVSSIIENITKEELTRDLGKAKLEVLSIIIYRGPIIRSEIDYIRGVNSSFILRNLLIRGLIDKKIDPKNSRGFLYSVTTEAISYLGISKIEEMPEYVRVRQEIEDFNSQKQISDNEQNTDK